jgi:hypothetical protein
MANESIGGVRRMQELETRVAWTAAVREREEIHTRIVMAFRQRVEGSGSGPSEADLMLFAQTAVKEHRLARDLIAARLTLVTRPR